MKPISFISDLWLYLKHGHTCNVEILDFVIAVTDVDLRDHLRT